MPGVIYAPYVPLTVTNSMSSPFEVLQQQALRDIVDETDQEIFSTISGIPQSKSFDIVERISNIVNESERRQIKLRKITKVNMVKLLRLLNRFNENS